MGGKHQEAAVTDGFILLGLLAVLFALVVGRTRRRVGLSFTGRTLVTLITGFAVVVLVYWVASTR
jgi:hypothetical protein